MSSLDLGIFVLGRMMEGKFPDLLGEVSDEALSQVDLAIPDIQLSAGRVCGEVLPRLSALSPGDYDGLLECLAELRELFGHTRGHLEEAEEALWKLSEVVAKRAEGKK